MNFQDWDPIVRDIVFGCVFLFPLIAVLWCWYDSSGRTGTARWFWRIFLTGVVLLTIPAIVLGAANTDDARLTLEVLKEARDHAGGRSQILNYAEAVGLVMADGKVRAVTVRDRPSGEVFSVKTRCVVNATGAWTGDVLALAGQDGAVIRPTTSITWLVTTPRRSPAGRMKTRPMPRVRMPADRLGCPGSLRRSQTRGPRAPTARMMAQAMAVSSGSRMRMQSSPSPSVAARRKTMV